MDKIVLGEEQLQALDLMKEFISSNVTAFSLIGSAGTGSLIFFIFSIWLFKNICLTLHS